MLTIEIICSKTKKVFVTRDEDGVQVREERQVPVWNDTVANLTLISLGTSAPEILLSVIETLGNNFCLGALGPGTIVGSASFNLMIITAVCIISIPGEATKKIKEYKVFATTSGFALGAYIWLVITIQVVSHDRVEWWEALFTLSMFPTLVGVSYWAQLNFCIKGKRARRSSIASTIHDPSIAPITDAEAAQPLFRFYNEWDNLVDDGGKLNPDKVKHLYTELGKLAQLTDEEIAFILATKLIQNKGHSILWYKIRAIQALHGGRRISPSLNDKLKEVMDAMNDMKRTDTGERGELRPLATSPDLHNRKGVVEFAATCIAVPGFVDQFTVVAKRHGKEDMTVFCKIESYDGTAKKNVAYLPISKNFVFEPYVVEQKILVHIIGDQHTNKDSNFFLKLSLTKENNVTRVALGAMTVMEVVIKDIEQPGQIQFLRKGQVVKDTVGIVDLDVERVEGADGLLRAKWQATPGPKCTRLPAVIEGVINFEHGEMKKILGIPITPKTGAASGADEQFDVAFTEIIGGGGKIGINALITVAISADDSFKLQVNRICELTEDLIAMQTSIPNQTYKEQIKSAFIVNGDWEEARRASRMDCILHWVSLPWKMVFCLLPPPHKLGGWPCFLCTLAMLGLLTTLVGDIANIFGHCLDLDPVVTGVTFVAIGTSLPDTFASRIAALESPTADAAIGNIMGSNSVNVFLGLGLPWTIASIYSEIQTGMGAEVHASSLAFIVTVYTLCAMIVQTVLWLRRSSVTFGFAELGGPKGSKWLTGIALIIGWGFYVLMIILASQRVSGLAKLSDNLSKALSIS